MLPALQKLLVGANIERHVLAIALVAHRHWRLQHGSGRRTIVLFSNSMSNLVITYTEILQNKEYGGQTSRHYPSTHVFNVHEQSNLKIGLLKTRCRISLIIHYQCILKYLCLLRQLCARNHRRRVIKALKNRKPMYTRNLAIDITHLNTDAFLDIRWKN